MEPLHVFIFVVDGKMEAMAEKLAKRVEEEEKVFADTVAELTRELKEKDDQLQIVREGCAFVWH